MTEGGRANTSLRTGPWSRRHRLLGRRLGVFNIRQVERLSPDEFRHVATLDALSAGQNGGVRAVSNGDSQPLKVRLELAAGDAGDFGADAAKVLRLAADRDLIADREAFTTDLTGACHRKSSKKP